MLLQGDSKIFPGRRGWGKNTKFVSEIQRYVLDIMRNCVCLSSLTSPQSKKTLQTWIVVFHSQGEAAFEGIPCSPGRVSCLICRNPVPDTGTRVSWVSQRSKSFLRLGQSKQVCGSRSLAFHRHQGQDATSLETSAFPTILIPLTHPERGSPVGLGRSKG